MADTERDYVLGTHDEEIERLGLQHRVWRSRVLDAWRRAGFTEGRTILDVGCGPGFASLDLAEIVGGSGRVLAIDRSRRFLDALEAERDRRRLPRIETHEIDLDQSPLPDVRADGAWVRWVFAFVTRRRDLLRRIAARLRPGAALVVHEYFDYRAWRVAPRSPEIEEFVSVVMDSWRQGGGEPDVGLEIPLWLGESGFRAREIRPIVEAIRPSDDFWRWPKTFVDVGLRRLVDLGRMTEERASAVTRALAEREASPDSLMITPAVMEIVAERL